MKVQTVHIGDKVTVSIPKLDRSKTDVPRLPCVIALVYEDKVKACMLPYNCLWNPKGNILWIGSPVL